MSDDPKERERKSGAQKPERERVTGNRERMSGSRPAPERKTGPQSIRDLAERERAETTFTGSGERERVTGSQPGPRPSAPPERERVTQKMGEVRERTTGTISVPGAVTAPKQLTQHQKQMLASAFQDTSRIDRLKSVVGNTGERPRDDDDDDEATALGRQFDGVTPAKELTGRDLFKTVQAPVQSREGRRSKKVFAQVLAQFAVANNPRYAAEGSTPSRGHIFVWDVSRAMNCEVPHFLGLKELNVAQTVDWVRHEGPSRGWTRGNNDDAVNAANAGQLVIALPREVRLKQIAIVVPSPADPDGRPRLCGAAVKVGADLSVYEALGVYAAEYFIHA